MDLYTLRIFLKPSDLLMTSIVCMSNGMSVFHTHFTDTGLANVTGSASGCNA